MNEITNVSTTPQSRFSLTRKNQKGQVAIFVALIFQVVFVFFALLINVGLLVHHKINLQQSTDLAAYYGAMKQAESLNAIAHINFQIKQAWKLLTWRYRIVGTFGFRKTSGGTAQDFPFENISLTQGFVYNGSRGANMTCNFGGQSLGVQDIPFFCIGHSGFSSWPQGESTCQLSCGGMTAARNIPAIPLASSIMTPYGGNVSGAVNSAVASINANLATLCERLGPTGATMLSRFISGYINETYPRIRTIEALAANLSLDADKTLDIEGNLIQKGSEATLKNNLTEANMAGFSSFKAENGLAGNNCKFQDGLGNKQEFLKKIEIKFVNYFIHNCTTGGGINYLPQNVYDPSGAGGLGSAFSNLPQQLKDIMLSVLVDGQRHTVGYEKNPHCVEYYAVKSSSEPQIPFLPLAKIKLNAVAVAKPFGGSIGPWYGKTWPKGASQSQFDDNNQDTKVDENLPIKDLSGSAGVGDITKSIFSQPNFSLYVGDKEGLRNLDYIAAYHSALAMRDIETYNGKTYNQNRNNGVILQNTGAWPNNSNWMGLDDSSLPDFRDYDGLATNMDGAAGMRALEISAIAPNQFDVTHYSIEPDFYNNYYRKLYNSGFVKILDATGKTGSLPGSPQNFLRADLGAVSMRADQNDQPAPLTERTFSVKDQILLKNIVMGVAPTYRTGPGVPTGTYTQVLNYLVSLQSSLLTGWTFLGFSDYVTFPAGPVDKLANTMSFGQCLDPWNNTSAANHTSSENYKTPMDTNSALPPVPGNCITGGRTGYSVKLVSPRVIRDSGALENPLDDGFFSF